jgi:hypothetical protein
MKTDAKKMAACHGHSGVRRDLNFTSNIDFTGGFNPDYALEYVDNFFLSENQ